MASSSTPRVATHLYWTKRRTRCFKSSGSWRCLIHSSVSLRLSLHSSSLKVIDCRYVYIMKTIFKPPHGIGKVQWQTCYTKTGQSTIFLHLSIQKLTEHWKIMLELLKKWKIDVTKNLCQLANYRKVEKILLLFLKYTNFVVVH